MLVAVLVIIVPLFYLFLKKLGLLLTGSSSSRSKLPPGPNTWQLLRKASEFGKQPHIAFTDLSKTYGPLMSLRLGSQIVIVASSATMAKEILQTQDKKFSGRYMPWVYYVFKAGQDASIATSRDCSNSWKYLRGICHSFLFSSKSVESKGHIRKAKVMEMVEYLRGKKGKIVEIDDLTNSIFCNIQSGMLVSRDLFGVTKEEDDVESGEDRVRASVHQLVEMASSSLGLSDLFPFLRRIDFGSKRNAVVNHRNIRSIWRDVIKERRLSPERGGDDNSGGGDVLDLVLDGQALTDDQICFLFTELLIAGTDSASILTVWLMVELIKNPHIMRRVIEEVAEAFEGDHTTINESVLTESRYLQACIKETLRLHNPGPFLMPHRALETCKIHDYTIPKDSIVLVNAWAISMDPESWKDATSFNPDRFLTNEDIDFRGIHFEFIPFSAGRRMCPGLNVAIKNIQIVVASLVHYFDWSLPNGADPTRIDMTRKFEGVLKKEKPLHLIPSLRDQTKMRQDDR